MVKVTSVSGIGKGKLGSTVYSVNAGQMIGRQYNPYVSNPNTAGQVDQRAKMKLMSQVAAALAPVIAIPKEGLRSSRNLFIKKNFEQASATAGVAQVTYENLQLTNGNAGLPAINVSRSAETGVSVSLDERCDAAITRVVYILDRKNSEATLQYVESIIIDAPGNEGKFPGTLYYVEGDIVVFAYGMKDLNARATAKYSNYNVRNGEDIAKLTLTRNISTQDYQFTQTRGTTLFAGESESTQIGANQARVYVTAAGPGTVAGAGVFDLNSSVTVTATPSTDATFVGWRLNGSETIISRNASYTFTLEGTTDLVAVFRDSSTANVYVLEISSEAENKGTVNPDGRVEVNAGESVTLTATPAENYIFDGWYKEGQSSAISSNATYTFTPNADMQIEARFTAWQTGDDNGGLYSGD